MKAIRVYRVGPPSVMQLEEVSDPQPGPGQVRVQVTAAGLHPVDTPIRSGNYARMPKFPYIPCAPSPIAGGSHAEALR